MSEQQTIRLKPAGKNLVRNPDTGGHLDKAGELVLPNQWWLRRLADGDVVEVKEAAEAPADEASGKTKEAK